MTDIRDRRYVYLNGRILPEGDATVPLGDGGLLYGMGFFETFRTSAGRVHHWEYHRRRLGLSCARAGMVLPLSFLACDEIRRTEVVRQLLKGVGLADAVFRYTVTAGVDGSPTEFLTTRVLPEPPDLPGITLRCLNLERDNGEWLPRPKSLNYSNAILGSHELKNRAADEHDEGLFLTRDGGFVVETARQNVAWIAGGSLRYPDLSLGCVAGTCLAWMLEQETTAESARASLEDLAGAEAIFVCNAVRGITPVGLLLDRGDGPIISDLESWKHPLITSLQRRWAAALTQTAER